MEAFSDGVFAIAITLLVLEISIPARTTGDLLQAVIDEWPSYLAYFVSFSTIGAVWLTHSVITEYLDHADALFLRLNLLLLLVVAFLPFPTSLIAQSIGSTDHERVAEVLYGVNLLLTGVLLSLLWRYAGRAGLLRPDITDRDASILTSRLTPGIGGYVVLIVVGLFRPTIAVVGYLVIAAFFLIPMPTRRRRDNQAAERGGT
jgi:uncharacterized membrane protein